MLTQNVFEEMEVVSLIFSKVIKIDCLKQSTLCTFYQRAHMKFDAKDEEYLEDQI